MSGTTQETIMRAPGFGIVLAMLGLAGCATDGRQTITVDKALP